MKLAFVAVIIVAIGAAAVVGVVVLPSLIGQIGDSAIESLELTNQHVWYHQARKDQPVIEEIKALSNRQAEIRRSNDYTSLARRLGLLENVQSVIRLHPCVVDYAVNFGVKGIGEHWTKFLEEDGDLSKDVNLVVSLSDAEFSDLGRSSSDE